MTAIKTVIQSKLQPRIFGKIILSLENSILSDLDERQTPSQQDGLDIEAETDLRILGCELIQTAGILLRLPQVRFLFFSFQRDQPCLFCACILFIFVSEPFFYLYN